MSIKILLISVVKSLKESKSLQNKHGRKEGKYDPRY